MKEEASLVVKRITLQEINITMSITIIWQVLQMKESTIPRLHMKIMRSIQSPPYYLLLLQI